MASYGPHFGEEGPLVGRGGSGTVFFSGCNLLCSFCQNCEISHGLPIPGARRRRFVGEEVDAERLAAIMRGLEEHGCENINLVTPSHVVPQILEAYALLEQDGGLNVPLVYNCNGYDRVETLALLDGVVDIYLPDFKFWKGRGSAYLGRVDDYGERAAEAVAEMHRQVGDLRIEGGTAVSGLLVRHLVMPKHLDDTARIMEFLAALSKDTYVNVMAQYRPHHRAVGDPVIGRRITAEEFSEAVAAARRAGLWRTET